jgi:hypothetical protein
MDQLDLKEGEADPPPGYVLARSPTIYINKRKVLGRINRLLFFYTARAA